MAKKFIGGAGFGIKFLFDEIKAGTDPLGPDNKLIFASGPLSGTNVPCTSRMSVTGRSPLTGAVGMALSGGHFPVELKWAGYDAMIIEGKSEEPIYVTIKDGDVKFRSAKKLWGMKTIDTQQIIKNDLHDQNVRVACIGPAGENKIKIASIINEWRAVGRKGLGAVMGSKNLKAIAIRGKGKVAIADKDKLKGARKAFTEAMKESEILYPTFSKTGTPMVVDATSGIGIFPTRNYLTTGEYNAAETLGVQVQMTRNVGSEACYGCPVGCSQLKLAKTGAYEGILTEGPEFETMYSYGGVTGVDNIDAVIAADRLADELGIDTISSGVSIAFAMELYERGILTKKDTGGIELTFGNDEAMITVLKQMAYREGIGDLLADGTRAAAEKIGKGSEKYAMHVKGLELPAYDVRGAKAHGLNYATSYTGADHCRGYAFQEIFGIPIPHEVDRFAAEGKGELTKWNQDIRMGTTDAPTMCAFLFDMALVGFAAQNTASLLEAVTGFTYTPDDILLAGERINNLAHAFNVREGFTRAHDTLPERILTEPLKGGTSKGHFISKDELDQMLDEYYTARGWDIATGIPSREKLTELGIEYVADQMP
jgi:aldehyde:ferredoxin oxidoreductase